MDKMKIGILLMLSIFLLFFSLQIYDFGDINLGNGFVYNEEHKHILGSIDVPPTVISYNYDKHFIVIKQIPKKHNDAIYDKKEYSYPLGRDTTYYWLIIKQEQQVFGPLDYDAFHTLTGTYNVPDHLLIFE